MLLYSVIALSLLMAGVAWHYFAPETRSRKKRQKVNRKPVARANRPTVQLFTKVD